MAEGTTSPIDSDSSRPEYIDIPEADALKMENMLLRKQLLLAEMERLEALEKAAHDEICARLGIRGPYQIDLAARKAFRKDE
jgi:hypothetical protein